MRIGAIASIELDDDHDHDPSKSAGSLQNDDDVEHLPLIVHLQSGEKLCGIDRIVVCTGYHITLPFLGEYHDDSTPPEKASDTVLVTDGTMYHNLHKDIFYIPDPTLAFVGVPYYTATFTLFEFQAMVVAAVLSGAAQLPEETAVRDEYRQRVQQHGVGREFNSLKDKEEIYVNDVLGWINRDRATLGLPLVEGHSNTWLAAKVKQKEWFRVRFAGNADDSKRPVLPVCG